MSDEDESGRNEAEGISSGEIADHKSVVESVFTKNLCNKFEIFSYRNAATILANGFPSQFKEFKDTLETFRISKTMLRTPGGNKGPITRYFESLMSKHVGWDETRILADLHVKLMHAKQSNKILSEYVRSGFLDGHRIDFLKGKVAIDFEWNSKDQTYDRDLYAFSAFYDAGAIDVGVIVTRGSSIDNNYLRALGRVLEKDGVTEGSELVVSKMGASTTWLGKLLYRLDAGRNGGCPVLAVGITPSCIAMD